MTDPAREALREALDNWHDDPNDTAQAMFVADLVTRHRDVLLADPAEREALAVYGQHLQHCDSWEDVESLDILGNLDVVPAPCSCGLADALAVDPVGDRELVPEGWRVEWLVEEPEGPGCGPRRTVGCSR